MIYSNSLAGIPLSNLTHTSQRGVKVGCDRGQEARKLFLLDEIMP
jgi:hypothetical protein